MPEVTEVTTEATMARDEPNRAIKQFFTSLLFAVNEKKLAEATRYSHNLDGMFWVLWCMQKITEEQQSELGYLSHCLIWRLSPNWKRYRHNSPRLEKRIDQILKGKFKSTLSPSRRR